MAPPPVSLPVVVVGVCTTVVVLLVTDVVLPGVVSVLVSVTVLAGVVTVVVLLTVVVFPGSVTVVAASTAPVAVTAAWVTADFAFCATVPDPAEPQELAPQATMNPETSAASSFRVVP
jgi:hypothetical protein